MGGAREEEKWKPDGTGDPEGWLGVGRSSHIWRIRGNVASISPNHSGPRKPAGVLGLVLCPPGPPPATWVLEAWEGGWGGRRVEVNGE